MALIVITLQDESDGTVSLGFTSEPVLLDEDITDAQALGVMGVSFFVQSLSGETQEDENPV